MKNIVLRGSLDRSLTHEEMDGNFEVLQDIANSNFSFNATGNVDEGFDKVLSTFNYEPNFVLGLMIRVAYKVELDGVANLVDDIFDFAFDRGAFTIENDDYGNQFVFELVDDVYTLKVNLNATNDAKIYGMATAYALGA